ncbi:MAG: NHL repeat-containing protein [Acidobacteriota bacterium]
MSLIIFLLLSSEASFLAKTIHNTMQEINGCESKVKITLVREWGGEETADKAKFFNEPTDIEIDRDGLVYIVDSGNHRIQVFDKSGKYINTIGRKGQGPADFLYPFDLEFDNKNNMIISDRYNSRIQILKTTGDFLKTFKINYFPYHIGVMRGGIIMYNGSRSLKSSSLILLYNYEGRIIREIGKRKEEKSLLLTLMKSSIYFSLDTYENIYTSYLYSPLLQKYSNTGELVMNISFEMPFTVPELKYMQTKSYIGLQAEQISKGLSIDNQGRIYLIVITRPRTKEEYKIGTKMIIEDRNRSINIIPGPKAYVDSETTDLYRLLVFNNSGKIITTKQLNTYCDNIKVYNDRLFIIDRYVGMKIYEYKINFE